MSLARNGIFAPNQLQAREMLKAFGLDEREWAAFSFHTALAGRQFDRIVVRFPVNPGAHDFDKIAHLTTRLAPEGKLTTIGPVLSQS